MNDIGNSYLKERNLKILKRILFEKKTATKTELSNISRLLRAIILLNLQICLPNRAH